ncbi:MAG TPA: chromosome segregation protein SMC [bacterium]|nr:chromosome segregation protein SMC [bacterium]HOH05922.1 chromosome segregation protein SMC [bacterium]HOY43575.1 chromosome segregation protein SMC [bacterium]HPG81962.1 chromosome segregation protein SMC [bacterium]HPM60241.1 chromosome segregation protein SMC [bacterium]
MYLSELTIVGFKSFAKKTHVTMHDGITGIVGPNGCGKSNIVDAIRWVMGEQKSGALRSEVMGNVIFNGTATAKPVGMAEVSLKIENSGNTLPIDYAEVIITRRLFRSGESQYLINGNSCRLKDILDLFMDTGAGPHTYSVIELPQVERILNGKEDERRHIFEEAAGITKYKLRRKATFRKLESTEKDLIRIEDIMSEVEKNVRSLRRQVAKAERYQEITSELRDLEIKLANNDYAMILDELEPAETRLELIRDEREGASSTLATQDADYETTRARLLEIEKKLLENQRTVSDLDREVQKLEERILVNKERIRSLEESGLRSSQERERFDAHLVELQQQYNAAQELYLEAEKNLTARREEYEKANGELQEVRVQFESKRSLAREAENRVLRITEELSRKQTEGERLKATEESLSLRLRQIEADAEKDAARATELTEILNKTRAEEAALADTLGKKKQRLTEISRREEEAKRLFETLQKSESQDRSRIEVLGHQAELVRRLIDNYEDYPAGVRFLATLKKEGFSTHGPLANIIHVENQHRTAIAAALGEAATYLVVEESNTAFNGIGLLREERRGIVTFAPRQEMGAILRERPLLSDLGVIGWADELVSCEDRYSALVRQVLGAFIVTQDLQTAHRVFAELRGQSYSVVTLTGEVLSHNGYIRGGVLSKNQSDFVGRQEQLAALTGEIEKLQQGLEARRIQLGQRETEIQENKIEAEKLRKEIQDSEQALGSLRIQLGRQTFEEQALAEAREKREGERQRIIGEVSQLGHNLELQNLGAGDLQTQRHESAERAAALSEEIKAIEEAVDRATGRARELNVAMARMQSEFEAMRRESDGLHRQIVETEALIKMRREDAENASAEIKELHQVNENYSQEVARQQVRRQEVQAVLDELEEQQYQANIRVAEAEKLIRASRGKFDVLSESAHQIELRVSELKLKAENLQSRLWNEFEYKLQRMAVDVDINPNETHQRLENLRERIKEVGPVNLLALKEFEQEKERLDFLQTQRDDLIKARKNLMETIEIINTTARQKFLETFEQVQRNFSEVFSKFFAGGRASLVLQETADPLESEIEILATPGGKKPAALTLLSGGEKSLTAISLLFAIYLVKPSPFCIFDEVDAPLDDQNVQRFTHALREFSSNTQFIVVTHNKLTMRAADQLYGVTMEEQGISKLVSVKFDSMKNDQLVPAASSAPAN